MRRWQADKSPPKQSNGPWEMRFLRQPAAHRGGRMQWRWGWLRPARPCSSSTGKGFRPGPRADKGAPLPSSRAPVAIVQAQAQFRSGALLQGLVELNGAARADGGEWRPLSSLGEDALMADQGNPQLPGLSCGSNPGRHRRAWPVFCSPSRPDETR